MEVFNQILNFIRDHYHVFIELAIALFVLFVTLFTKKVKISSVFELVLMDLPTYILEAESKFSDGPSKYSYVFNRCVERIAYLTGLNVCEILKKYTAVINDSIENVLATPQKKER